MRFENLIAGAVLLSGLVFSAPAGAQQGDYARMVVIDPKPGQDQAFADGYRRHLRWHEENHDPWSWHGWTFVLGERMGQFMDGTFDHAPDALTAPSSLPRTRPTTARTSIPTPTS